MIDGHDPLSAIFHPPRAYFAPDLWLRLEPAVRAHASDRLRDLASGRLDAPGYREAVGYLRALGWLMQMADELTTQGDKRQ